MRIQETINFLIEIFFFASAIYLLLRFLRSTRGGGIVRGLIIISVILGLCLVILINTQELPRLEYVFKSIVETVVLALVILFQPELRRGISRLGEHPLLHRLSLDREFKILGEIQSAAERLSKLRIGALIAIERDTSLDSYMEEAVKIDAVCNALLLESIFHPGGALHDGAAILRGERIVAARCLFPLTENPDIPQRLGTRHRAGIGLSEATDAIAVVVSEETGEISLCVKGEIQRDIKPANLDTLLKNVLTSSAERPLATSPST